MLKRCVYLVLFLGCCSALLAENPAIFYTSDPTWPNETVLIEGDHFTADSIVMVARAKDGRRKSPGKKSAPKIKKWTKAELLQVSDHSIKFLVPEKWKMGMFICKVVNGKQQSQQVTVNAPDVWWVQGDSGMDDAAPGGWLAVFGKCLSFNDDAKVLLQSETGKNISLAITTQSRWALRIKNLPKKLKTGKYTVFVHNGFGGKAGWRKAGQINIRKPDQWKTDVYNILDFGARRDDFTDDTAAIKAALKKAEQNGGGTVYIPWGDYDVNETLIIPPFVTVKGAGMESSQLAWQDRENPLPALIRATGHFAIKDLTITAINHSLGITNGPVGKNEKLIDEKDLSNIRLERLRLRLNAFVSMYNRYEKDIKQKFNRSSAEEFARRIKTSHRGRALYITGYNVQITDCDVHTSLTGQVFIFNQIRGGYIARNNFIPSQGTIKGGNYRIPACEELIFEYNKVVGGGTVSSRGDRVYTNNVYYSHNKVGPNYNTDREEVTLHPGVCGARIYYGTTVADGKNLTLPSNLGGGRDDLDWTGGGIYILKGRGAGQHRKITSRNGLVLEMDSPWKVNPDKTSVVSIAERFEYLLFIDNDFSDAAITVQPWRAGGNIIFAENRTSRAGGFRAMGGWSGPGLSPSWHLQVLDNTIADNHCHYRHTLDGNGLRLMTYPLPKNYDGPVIQGVIMRNNILKRSTVEIWDFTDDVVVENNTIINSTYGINVKMRKVDHHDKPLMSSMSKDWPMPSGILLRNNKFDNVIEQFTEIKPGQVKIIETF